MIRVVLADDSFLAREGLTHVLGSIDDVELVASCADLDELRSTVDVVRPDVVLTDIRMPPTNTDEGIRYAGELWTSLPEIGVVVLSQHAEPVYALSLFENGSSRRATCSRSASRTGTSWRGRYARSRRAALRRLANRRSARLQPTERPGDREANSRASARSSR